ncbi:hypothetical protein AB0893_26290 [Micromonospora aurantiaca]|uniref:hypothetical protein n=1 Tax=Micromonospora aurantiaca (nom. illeg.) TaxID=47850 RepID=UPI003456F972
MADDRARWCRSCGSDPTANQVCSVCGTPLDPPDDGPERIGRVVVRKRLITRLAIAVGERNDDVLVLEHGDATAAVPAEQFDRLPSVESAPAGVRSAAGRLWAALGCAAVAKARWSPEAVAAAALRLATATLGARRAAAIDLIALGRPLPAELDLSDTEIAWYRAHTAAVAGDVPAALKQLGVLPPARYAARVGLLLSRFPDLERDPACAASAIPLLTPFVSRSLDALALVAALDPAATDVVEVAARYSEAAGLALADGPYARALAAYLEGLAGVPSAVPAQILSLLPVPLLDRLITAGALTEVPPGLPAAAATHVRCRLAPEQVDDETLIGAGFTAEAARRAYLAGDTAKLAGLSDGDEAVRHYRALREYVDTGRLREEDLRPDARAVVRLTDAVAIDFAGRRSVPEPVAADPTTWPRLWRNAMLGKVTAAADVRQRHPQFGLWLDLCLLYPTLQTGRWAEAAETGQTVARDADDPRTRAEALNLAAYAHWQLGRGEEALQLLDRALAIRPVAGLAVNAALIAEESSYLAALPYLARTMQLARDDDLRRSAVQRALDLWQAYGRLMELPATLGAMIRATLAVPCDDDALHRWLLLLALQHDRSWLLRAAVTSSGQVQALTARYYRARAALEEERSTTTLTEIATALGALWTLPARSDWADAERDWLAATIDEILAEEPAASLDALPAVKELIRHEVLDLSSRIRFGARAAVRIITQTEWSPAQRSPSVAENALVTAVATYRRRRGELNPAELRAIDEFLGDRVEEAAVAVGNAAIKFFNGMVKRWRELQRSAAMTWQENQPNMAERRGLVTTLRAHVERCERYLRLTRELPVRAEVVRWLTSFVEECRRQLPFMLRHVV